MISTSGKRNMANLRNTRGMERSWRRHPQTQKSSHCNHRHLNNFACESSVCENAWVCTQQGSWGQASGSFSFSLPLSRLTADVYVHVPSGPRTETSAGTASLSAFFQRERLLLSTSKIIQKKQRASFHHRKPWFTVSHSWMIIEIDIISWNEDANLMMT